ncbi:hypothetical protein BBD42_13075 [Paenibacillus sp. BIHB 4019]|uniref:RNA polymerase sigma-70 region 4 domain-containing protein n=1 Tax=Paenibacillus sp. BIHB 4019 TaxID=1870819 RepID=A0A1B2DHY1_9BACL|nr:sigma factor-like helix-turn-helix DNA-binding protein [Paenibacillus sp. BIHB 4019]ANY67303.1 hypothetical protein BBD42_13075 [Paenibacillus sp. BIHB 4019]
MGRENVTELLKNYPSYKYAVRQFERHQPSASAGIANYSGMSGGSGAPERFFEMVGKPADMGHTSYNDRIDYLKYSDVIKDIDGALDTLTDEERSVVLLKWIEGVSLKDISERKRYSVETVKRNHKRALEKLSICFRFIRPPQIEDIHAPGSQHHRYPEKDGMTLF